METNIVLILGLSIGLAVFLGLIFQILIKQEKQFWNTLPSLEEAQQQITKAYPDFVDCFELTKKVTDTMHGNWGATVHFYGDFLVCKELGVSIRVRLGEKMS